MATGTYVLPSGEVINLADWVDDIIYDSETIPASGTSISAGAEYTFFRDIQNKDLIDTNMMISSKLPSGWEMVVWRIGFVVGLETALSDLQLIANRGYAQFLMGQNKIVRQGPLFTFQVGYGIQGAVSTDGNASATTVHTAQIGPVGTALVAPLSIPIYIRDDDTFKATVKFFTATTVTAGVKVWSILQGWIKRPVR